MENSEFHGLLSQFVLPVYGRLEDGSWRCAGSCVVICTAKDHALAYTAKHVTQFLEDIVGPDKLNELRIDPAFRRESFDDKFGPVSQEKPVPDFNADMWVIIPSVRSRAQVHQISIMPGPELDVALLGLQLPLGRVSKFPMQVRIMSHGPQVGDEVALVGYPAGNVALEVDHGNLQVEMKMKSVLGKVVERFGWNDHFLTRSPGFIVDVGVPSGMSGGAVLYNHPQFGPVLCGLISSSDDSSRTLSVMLYPTLILNNVIPHDASVPNNLLGLCEMGGIFDVHDAPSHLTINANEPHTRPEDLYNWKD